MKKLYLLFILVVFLMSACSTNKKSQIDIDNADNLFENRLKCNKLKEQIKNDVINEELNLLFIENKGKGNSFTYDELYDVFYSPQKESCLYVIKIDYPEESPLKEVYKLHDYFTKAYIDNCAYGKKEEDNYMVEEFWQNIKQLKEK